jgi:hypothetical protein
VLYASAILEHTEVKEAHAWAKNAIQLLKPFLRIHSQNEFKNYLVILSSKRSKWIYTA